MRRVMVTVFWALWVCACSSSEDDDRQSGAVDMERAADQWSLDAEFGDAALPPDRGPYVTLHAIQAKGYHRSNWYSFDPELDPEYQGHSRPQVGGQVTDDDARVFHLGFSPFYKEIGPNGEGMSHWGGQWVRNRFDDGDCIYPELGIDAPQALCRTFTDCLRAISDGDRDYDDPRPRFGQVGGAARLPTAEHAPIFFLIEPQYGMWTDELLACFSEEEQLRRAIDPWYMPNRLEWFPAVQFRDRIFKPSDLQGDAHTLRDAATQHRWPTMDQLWGRYIFILYDRGVVRDAYREGVGLIFEEQDITADDPKYFVLADDPEDPDAAFFSVPAAETDRIRALVDQGFMVHAHSLDPDEIEAARRAGAHLLTALEITDIGIPGPTACNPVTADAHCAPDHFERPPPAERDAMP